MAKRSKEKTAKRREEKDMRPTARARYIRISPSKVRIVLNVVRGKSVNEAMAMLEAIPNASAEVVNKLVKSAVANAEFKGLSRSDLYIAEIFADGGPSLKRMNPVSKGRGHAILKRTSHITVLLDEIKEGK